MGAQTFFVFLFCFLYKCLIYSGFQFWQMTVWRIRASLSELAAYFEGLSSKTIYPISAVSVVCNPRKSFQLTTWQRETGRIYRWCLSK